MPPLPSSGLLVVPAHWIAIRFIVRAIDYKSTYILAYEGAPPVPPAPNADSPTVVGGWRAVEGSGEEMSAPVKGNAASTVGEHAHDQFASEAWPSSFHHPSASRHLIAATNTVGRLAVAVVLIGVLVATGPGSVVLPDFTRIPPPPQLPACTVFALLMLRPCRFAHAVLARVGPLTTFPPPRSQYCPLSTATSATGAPIPAPPILRPPPLIYPCARPTHQRFRPPPPRLTTCTVFPLLIMHRRTILYNAALINPVVGRVTAASTLKVDFAVPSCRPLSTAAAPTGHVVLVPHTPPSPPHLHR
ncbi:hypothetical protein B0H13DRAFT_2337441 [Mycena leptocephala]|nr:hypothetical protein B0H13DRAFT_2337441 [Mycena leptocephala]